LKIGKNKTKKKKNNCLTFLVDLVKQMSNLVVPVRSFVCFGSLVCKNV